MIVELADAVLQISDTESEVESMKFKPCIWYHSRLVLGALVDLQTSCNEYVAS
jgi:hypothetical protein